MLKSNGVFTSSGGFENLFWALATRVLGGKRVLFVPPKDVKSNLAFIKRLVAGELFHPVIDRVYPLDKMVEAFTAVGTGQKTGNGIITLEA